MERFIIRKTTRNIKLKKDMEIKIINKMEDTEDVVDIKDIELCLKIDKTIDFMVLSTKEKKEINNLI